MVRGYKMMNNGEVQVFVSPLNFDTYIANGWQFGKLSPVWNAGLTAEDPRVAKNIQKITTLSDKQRKEIGIKISSALTGRKLAQETIAKRSSSVRGRKSSESKKRKISASLMGHTVSAITRARISVANRGKGHPMSGANRAKLSVERSSKEWQAKHNAIKKAHNTFNTSKPEDRAYTMLYRIFGNNVIRSYRDERYNHNCDFYIKPFDLFIELNYHWTHGGHPFDAHDETCIEQLQRWQTKNSQFYKQAIRVWTQLDVSKRKDFECGHLNHKIFYKEKDFNLWFEGWATSLGTKYFQ